jgi:hypothetical protein
VTFIKKKSKMVQLKALLGNDVSRPWLVHEGILGILAVQPGLNGQLSCIHSFKIF